MPDSSAAVAPHRAEVGEGPAAPPGQRRAVDLVYLSYTGLMEPLGRSQVLAYLQRLSEWHDVVLISFEKPEDLRDGAKVAAAEAACEAAGIRWRPKTYHQRPRLPATLWDMAVMLREALAALRGKRNAVLHARGYIASAVAMMAGGLRRAPFIFDMRALWLDEMIGAGRLRRGGSVHRVLQWIERQCLRKAAAVVSLSEAAIPHLLKLAGEGVSAGKFHVIRTCVDLDKFRPGPAPEQMALGSVGTVLSGWFRLQELMTFLAFAKARWPDARLQVVTRDVPGGVRAAAVAAGVGEDELEVFAAAPAQVPAVISSLTAAVIFLQTGLVRLGSCPTRLGEFLACGVPVVVNDGVGDVTDIVEGANVGMVVRSLTREGLEEAADRLAVLLADPELKVRCRRVAEALFSVDDGAREYDRIYQDIGCTGGRS